jgi:hypothetical protein
LGEKEYSNNVIGSEPKFAWTGCINSMPKIEANIFVKKLGTTMEKLDNESTIKSY